MRLALLVSILLAFSLGCGGSAPSDPEGGIVFDASGGGDGGLDAALDGAAMDAASDAPITELCNPESMVRLPSDDGLHPDAPIEWWYWTGHLQDALGRFYGYQVTFFDFGLASLMNVALTDVEGAVFHRDASFVFAGLPATADGFEYAFDTTQGVGGAGLDHLSSAFGTVGFDLTLSATQTPVLHHGDGREDYPFGGYTFYYSRTRMETTGMVHVGGEDRVVTGTSWFDHQWGDLAQATNLGWDWFAIQLEDGRDIMLFSVRGTPGFVGGTLSGSDCGGARELLPSEIVITPQAEWTSPETACVYPILWDLQVAGINLTITPVMQAQEHANARDVARSYWEGASTVSGDAQGRAYVELTGYCGP